MSDISTPGDMAKPDWCSVPDCYFSFTDCGCSVSMGSIQYTITCTSGLASSACSCSTTGGKCAASQRRPGWRVRL